MINKRRETIKFLALAGFGLYIPSCATSSEKNNTDDINASSENLEKESEIIEKSFRSNNVTLIYKKDIKYNQLQHGYNLRINKYPNIIALFKNTKGVSEAIFFANTMEWWS